MRLSWKKATTPTDATIIIPTITNARAFKFVLVLRSVVPLRLLSLVEFLMGHEVESKSPIEYGRGHWKGSGLLV